MDLHEQPVSKPTEQSNEYNPFDDELNTLRMPPPTDTELNKNSDQVSPQEAAQEYTAEQNYY